MVQSTLFWHLQKQSLCIIKQKMGILNVQTPQKVGSWNHYSQPEHPRSDEPIYEGADQPDEKEKKMRSMMVNRALKGEQSRADKCYQH